MKYVSIVIASLLLIFGLGLGLYKYLSNKSDQLYQQIKKELGLELLIHHFEPRFFPRPGIRLAKIEIKGGPELIQQKSIDSIDVDLNLLSLFSSNTLFSPVFKFHSVHLEINSKDSFPLKLEMTEGSAYLQSDSRVVIDGDISLLSPTRGKILAKGIFDRNNQSGALNLEISPLSRNSFSWFRGQSDPVRIQAAFSWKNERTATVLSLSQLTASSKKLSLTCDGTVAFEGDTIPIKIHTQIKNSDVVELKKWMPYKVLSQSLAEFLDKGLVSGTITQAESAFEFTFNKPNGKLSKLKTLNTVNFDALALKFHPEWEEIEGLHGSLQISEKGLLTQTLLVNNQNFKLNRASVVVDFEKPSVELVTDISTQGPTAQEFLKKSGLKDTLAPVLDRLVINDEISYTMNLYIPFNEQATVLESTLHLKNNRITWMKNIQILNMSGDIEITTKELSSKALQARVFNQDLVLSHFKIGSVIEGVLEKPGTHNSPLSETLILDTDFAKGKITVGTDPSEFAKITDLDINLMQLNLAKEDTKNPKESRSKEEATQKATLANILNKMPNTKFHCKKCEIGGAVYEPIQLTIERKNKEELSLLSAHIQEPALGKIEIEQGNFKISEKGVVFALKGKSEFKDLAGLLHKHGAGKDLKGFKGVGFFDLQGSTDGDSFKDTKISGKLSVDFHEGKLSDVHNFKSFLDLLTLDFRSTVTKSTHVHQVKGFFEIEDNRMRTQKTYLSFSTFLLEYTGVIDLKNESYDGTSVLYLNVSKFAMNALAFLVNPLVGVVNTVYGHDKKTEKNFLNTLSKMKFNISGPWQNPKIEKN